ERQVKTGIPATGNQPVTRAVARSGPGASPPEPTEVALHPEVGPPLPMTAQAAPPPTPAPQAPAPAPAAASPPAPGQFEVSEEAAERALERTLVATGNLVVPQGFAEFEPLFSYARRESPALVLFNVNRNELSPAVDVRV